MLDSAAGDASSADHGLALARDGTPLWWEWAPQCGAPDGGPALCLLNGANCSIHYWSPMLRFLGPRVPVLLTDYRGHGRSGRGIDPESVTIERLADDVLAQLDAAGCERAVLVGHSLGVMVALAVWRQAPERVAGLVPMFGTCADAAQAFSSSPAAPLLLQRVMAALGYGLRPLKRPLATLTQTRPMLFAAELLGSNHTLVPHGYILQLFEHIETMDPAVVFGCYRAAFAYDATCVLPGIDAPTLIFAGERDRMTPLARARAMQAAIPQAELFIVPGGSHLGLLERADVVHRRLARFLDDHGLARPAVTAAAAADGGGQTGAPRGAVAARLGGEEAGAELWAAARSASAISAPIAERAP